MRTRNTLMAAVSIRGLLFLGALTMVTCYIDGQGRNIFRLQILHTNDMHSHFHEFNQSGKFCSTDEANCFGGFPRLKTAISLEKEKAKDHNADGTLFLNAGDTFTGTAFYSFFKWNIVAELLPDIGIDVMSLGNHEFDGGLEDLDSFLGSVDIPIVACNVDVSQVVPALVNQNKILKSKILEVNGHRIGVIGYVTRETPTLSNPGNMTFSKEIPSIRKEAQRLKNVEHVNIIIAVGHSGFEIDQQIAKEVEEIDLVVGGHSDTFLYNGEPPDVEKAEGPYPFCVTQSTTNRQVPVVQAFHVTKYLGQLWVDFDENGEVLRSYGNPILMDSSIPQDNDLLQKVENFQMRLDERTGEKVGHTNVFLDGKSCKLKECNFGNFITDAFIDYYMKHMPNDGKPIIALQQSGGIRNDIDNVINSGDITYRQLMTALPFRNKLGKIQMIGSDIRSAIERGFKHFDGKNPHGEFMQVSGLRIEMDFSQSKNNRLVSIKVMSGESEFIDLDSNENYSVLINEYMWEGGGGFQLTKISNFESFGISDFEIIKKNIHDTSPIMPEVVGRITLKNIASIRNKHDNPHSNLIDDHPLYSAQTCGSIRS